MSVPVPKYLAGVSGSGAEGGAVAPMTGTIEKVDYIRPAEQSIYFSSGQASCDKCLFRGLDDLSYHIQFFFFNIYVFKYLFMK